MAVSTQVVPSKAKCAHWFCAKVVSVVVDARSLTFRLNAPAPVLVIIKTEPAIAPVGARSRFRFAVIVVMSRMVCPLTPTNKVADASEFMVPNPPRLIGIHADHVPIIRVLMNFRAGLIRDNSWYTLLEFAALFPCRTVKTPSVWVVAIYGPLASVWRLTR